MKIGEEILQLLSKTVRQLKSILMYIFLLGVGIQMKYVLVKDVTNLKNASVPKQNIVFGLEIKMSVFHKAPMIVNLVPCVVNVQLKDFIVIKIKKELLRSLNVNRLPKKQQKLTIAIVPSMNIVNSITPLVKMSAKLIKQMVNAKPVFKHIIIVLKMKSQLHIVVNPLLK